MIFLNNSDFKIITIIIWTFIMMILMIIKKHCLVIFVIIVIIMITQKRSAASHYLRDNAISFLVLSRNFFSMLSCFSIFVLSRNPLKTTESKKIDRTFPK